MADKAPTITFTIHALVLDLPDNIGFGTTPEAAEAALFERLAADFADHAERDDILTDAGRQAYAVSLLGSLDSLRRFIEAAGEDPAPILASLTA